MGNRQMANQNTDDIFKNRKEILKALKIEDGDNKQIHENFRDSLLNEGKIDFFYHLAGLNSVVAKVNEEMS